MASADTLEIVVDTEVQVRTADAPKKVLDALRRQLRQHDQRRLVQHDGSQRGLLALLQTRQGRHRLPQALLTRVTQTCSRHGVPYEVVDRRAMVSCPALRCRHTLGEQQQVALRRLSVHDSGVLVAPRPDDRQLIAAELIARRQQCCLLLAADEQAAERWLEWLRDAFGLDAPYVCRLAQAKGDRRVAVSSYQEVAGARAGVLGREYGMVVFDALDRVDPIGLMRAVRAVGARYLLGLAERASRDDGLHGPLFLALGGLVHQASAPATERTLRLACRFNRTAFTFPYRGRSEYQSLIAALARDEARNQQIAHDIEREAVAGHSCLVLSERRDHLDALAARLPAELAVGVVTSAVRPSDRSELLARFRQAELTVLLATSQLILDRIESLRPSRLFISFPFSYARKLEQAVRQLVQPAKGKADAIVFDYDDVAVAPFHRQFAKRAKLLERLKREAERDYLRWAQLSLGV